MKHITYAFVSNKGSREINEDCVKIAQAGNHYSFVLCDGLGGHDKGEVASAFVADYMVKELVSKTVSEENMCAIVFEAQEQLLKKQKELFLSSEMKTTAVMLSVDDSDALWGHVGDSRLYYFKNKRLKEHTLDHSVPQMLVFAGEIKDKDIRFHPDRNRLLKVMGAEWSRNECEVDKEIKLEKNQAFLLCSDGFWELINEKEMTKALKKSKNVEQWLEEMETIVKNNGKGKNMDNYSAICVWIKD